jgi:16S rRNA (cytosine967-C5)-methyltransferase
MQTLDAIQDGGEQLEQLDWILIDAPCSNTGVLARRPEIRYRLAVRSLPLLAQMQLAILQQAADLAKPGTRLMYSTCSIDPEENEQVCSKFLADRSEWQYVDGNLTLPSPGPTPRDWHDGGFWAILARREP